MYQSSIPDSLLLLNRQFTWKECVPLPIFRRTSRIKLKFLLAHMSLTRKIWLYLYISLAVLVIGKWPRFFVWWLNTCIQMYTSILVSDSKELTNVSPMRRWGIHLNLLNSGAGYMLIVFFSVRQTWSVYLVCLSN